MQTHKIVRYAAAVPWVEFECGSCGVDMDMFDHDRVDIIQTSKDGHEFWCPNCHDVLPVKDITP